MRIKRDFIGMFDGMKGILMLVIVLIHHVTFASAVEGGAVVDGLMYFFRYSVEIIALFFICAGYSAVPAKNFREYAEKQAKTLLIPYFLVMIACVLLVTVLFLCQGKFRIQEISTRVLAFLYGSMHPFELFGQIWVAPVVAMWFLPTLFWGNILQQLFLRITNRKLAQVCVWTLVAAAVAVPPAEELPIPWFLVQGCTALGFLEIGRLLKQYKLLFKKPNPWALIAVTLLWVWLHWRSEANVGANIWKFWMLDYAGGAAFAAAVLQLYLASGLAAARIMEPFAYIGRHSLYFLCVHGTELLVFPWLAELRPDLLSLPLPMGAVICLLFLARVAVAVLGCMVLVRVRNYLRRKRLSKE